MRTAVASVVLAAVLCACSGTASTPSASGSPSSAIDNPGVARLSAWASEQPLRYQFRLRASCGERAVVGTWDIWVDQTRTSQPVVRVRGLDRPGRYVVRKYRWEIPTLSDIVDEAVAALRTNPHGVTIGYWPNGAVRTVSLDPFANAIDDEACYRIGQVRPLPPPGSGLA
jgi:hypothetical protein